MTSEGSVRWWRLAAVVGAFLVVGVGLPDRGFGWSLLRIALYVGIAWLALGRSGGGGG